MPGFRLRWRPAWYRDFVLRKLPPGTAGVEVGVFRGEFSERILRIARPSKLYLVDPWLRSEELPSRVWGTLTTQGSLDDSFGEVRRKFGSNPAVEIRRAFSTEFAPTLPDGSLSWIYLDGDHREASVYSDLTVFWPKIRAGGLVVGDDYDLPNTPFQDGVTKGVRRFTAERKLPFELPGRHQFIVRKPGPAPPSG